MAVIYLFIYFNYYSFSLAIKTQELMNYVKKVEQVAKQTCGGAVV